MKRFGKHLIKTGTGSFSHRETCEVNAAAEHSTTTVFTPESLQRNLVLVCKRLPANTKLKQPFEHVCLMLRCAVESWNKGVAAV